ncbi:MAG: GerMN domain-containing protein [Treponemataceae bacterium]|nr:GerMN domain-containing protein [Treponemataceae bacterium]
MKKKAVFLTTLLFLSVGISLFCYIQKSVNAGSVRRLFIFESYDNSERSMEVRYLHEKNGEAAVREFIEELLLGPMSDRYIRLFPYGTRLLSCFIRDNVLYIDLSEEAALRTEGTSDTERACTLLKENVRQNFADLTDYKIFMMGNEVYASGTVFE